MADKTYVQFCAHSTTKWWIWAVFSPLVRVCAHSQYLCTVFCANIISILVYDTHFPQIINTWIYRYITVFNINNTKWMGKAKKRKRGRCTFVNTLITHSIGMILFYMRRCRHSLNRGFCKMQFHFTFTQGLSAGEILLKCQINSFLCATWNVVRASFRIKCSYIGPDTRDCRISSKIWRGCRQQFDDVYRHLRWHFYSAIHFESANVLFSKRTRFEHFV